jgi:hypothetical protein
MLVVDRYDEELDRFHNEIEGIRLRTERRKDRFRREKEQQAVAERQVNTVVARKEKLSSIALDVEFEFADRSGQ